MRRFLPELVGAAILLALGAVALLLIYHADSATDMVLALVCLAGMRLDIWVYRRWSRARTGTDPGAGLSPAGGYDLDI
jgi:hypothetical protein